MTSAGSSEVYSTEETRIGTWLGKPLYRIVIETTTPSAIDVNTKVGDIPPYAEVKNFYGTFRTNSTALLQTTCNGGYQNDVRDIIILYCDGNRVMLMSGASRFLNKPCWIVLEYTKTTDTV